MQQLPLDLALAPRFGRDDYLVSPVNAATVAALDRWPDWPDRVFLLLGPEGAGKSHLAAIWAARAAARFVTADDLDRIALPELVDGPIVIEDVDRMTGQETRLFHLLNLVRERSYLLLTARRPPDEWGLQTADLLSRLRLATRASIEAPDDDLLRAVLVKLFADRQLLVDEAVVGYLILRLERSLAAARHIVDLLDRTAFALNRRVTRSMAAKLFETLPPDGD